MKKYLFGAIFIASNALLYAQVGIGTNEPKASLDVNGEVLNTKIVDGILAPRITGNQLKAKDEIYTAKQNSAIVYVTEAVVESSLKTKKVTSPGYYYYYHPEIFTAEEGYWEKIGSSEFSLPQFFYMPSVVLPTDVTDARILDVTNTNYSVSEEGVFTVNLYILFKNQFSSPITSSNTSKDILKGFVLNADQYEYVVAFADLNVFKDILVSANGELTYKVTEGAIVRNGSFMNIVLKVK